MPIFEFRCLECGHEFEKLVFSSVAKAVCARCGSDRAERKVSRFGTSGTEKRVSGRAACAGCSSGSCASCH